MALFVDSAYLDDITTVARILPLAGVTTNPTILLAARQQGQMLAPPLLLRELLQRTSGTVFMQPSLVDEELAYHQALTYIAISPDRVLPKIPMTQLGMRVALRLKLQGHKIAFTAVTTVSQAYAAAMLNAEYIIPYYNRMQRSGVDASDRIACMARLLKTQTLSTRILAASIKSSTEAARALLAGAHDLTVPPQVLLEMVTDPDSEEAVAKFEQDWDKMKNL